MRDLLKDGCLVIRVTSAVPFRDGVGAAVETEGCCYELWLHVAFCLLSPWTLSMHLMRRTANPGEADDGRRVYLEAVCVVTDWNIAWHLFA